MICNFREGRNSRLFFLFTSEEVLIIDFQDEAQLRRFNQFKQSQSLALSDSLYTQKALSLRVRRKTGD